MPDGPLISAQLLKKPKISGADPWRSKRNGLDTQSLELELR